ncbi:poly-beta-1,6-N-acetyl-D-glucosamine biosynthesis protein PgaD [Halothiobacillus sp. DCM-1]|uniref:poly-beta-1,6-N-acetyl-D-glucosamine biosynthesis protein PgaD n=1 Tax=Halothiobacillus sp. DCM-1 TaxID=3112558 RepID=UPI00324B978F
MNQAQNSQSTPSDEWPRIPELIQRHDLVPVAKRGVLTLIATVGWALWIYMLLPLGALLAWWFGYQRLDIFVLAEPGKTLATLTLYSLIILLAGLLFVFWAVYNWLRFRGMDRRNAPKPVGAEEIAQAFHLPRESVQLAQGSAHLIFHFAEDGHITRVTASGARAFNENPRPSPNHPTND